MNKTRFLTLLSIGLLIINLVLLGFIFLRKPKQRPPDALKKTIISKLALDEKQISLYDSMVKQHVKAVNAANDSIVELKKILYNSLKNDENTLQNDSLISKINQIQTNIEHIHLAHFQAIKTICTPDQLPKYYELTEDIIQHLSPPKRPERK